MAEPLRRRRESAGTFRQPPAVDRLDEIVLWAAGVRPSIVVVEGAQELARGIDGVA
jgi:hypothetical protein